MIGSTPSRSSSRGRASRRSAAMWRSMTASSTTRSRPALRARTTSRGRSSTIAATGIPCRRAAASQDARSRGPDVGGVDDGALAARRGGAPTPAPRAANAGPRRPLVRLVAGDRARKASDDRISSAANRRRASVDLPDPAGPTSRTSTGSGRREVGHAPDEAAYVRGASTTPDLVAGLGRPDLVGRLVVHRRAAAQRRRHRGGTALPCHGHCDAAVRRDRALRRAGRRRGRTRRAGHGPCRRSARRPGR